MIDRYLRHESLRMIVSFEASPVTFHIAFSHLYSGALRIARAESDLGVLFGAHIARMSMVAKACSYKRSCLLESQRSSMHPRLVTEVGFHQGSRLLVA